MELPENSPLLCAILLQTRQHTPYRIIYTTLFHHIISLQKINTTNRNSTGAIKMQRNKRTVYVYFKIFTRTVATV